MCRLFAFVSPVTASARGELGADGMESLLSLARLHGDGWGRASVRAPGDAPIVTRSAISAAEDPDFDAALATPCRAAVVHLRWATAGLPVNIRNAHPFEADGIAFAHNGTIKPRETLQGLLSADSVAPPPAAMVTKLYWASWHRDLGELAMAVLGPEALLGEPEPGYELTALQRLFLFTRSDTIYAGSNQIQRNIIGERALGLPKEPAV